jgi:hypothetical protein
LVVGRNPLIGWRNVSIDQVLDRCAGDLIERGLATSRRGFTTSELEAVDRRLGRPMPDELRAFYRRVTPVPHWPDPEYGLIAFQPPDDEGLTWLDDPTLRAEKLWVAPPAGECWLAGWGDARLLAIGYTPFGDWLLWCDGLQGRPVGTVVLTDHDSDENPIVLGDSLAQWLGRYHTFGLSEYAIAPAGLDDIERNEAFVFLSDHLRLNPESAWAREKLRKLS